MKYIFSDFDGTLTDNGQMSAVFFDLLDLLKKNNYQLVIVSGRSISWGHFFLTHFPMNFAIMEGGGVISQKIGNLIHDSALITTKQTDELTKISNELRANKKIIFAADSFGRFTDRAIEFKAMDKAELVKLESFLSAHDFEYSYSNVHLNFWKGEISKFRGVEKFCKDQKINYKDCYFFGDALNDESMFEHFPKSVGVSNISTYLNKMKFKPATILEGHENREIFGVYNYLSAIFQQE